MGISGFNESSLTTSEIFKGLNDTTDIKSKAVNLIKNAKQLTPDDIEVAYIGVKSLNDTLTRNALHAYDNGKIILIYNDVPSLSISQSLPFITFKVNNEYKTYVFMDKYITKNRNGIINLQAVVLRDLLQGALIANALKNNYNILSSNQYMQKTLMELYTKFVMRIINKEFSILSEKIVSNTIEYWINKFFLLRILGATDSPENIELLCIRNLKHINDIELEEIKNKYNEFDPIDVRDLINLIKEASPRLKTLQFNIFVSNWINYYYMPSLLAIDNIEYLIFMIITLLSGNNIISISAGEMVRNDKNIKSFKEELIKLT